jgi:uncharacterized protein YuzE
MKVKYFKDTDTLYTEFSADNIAETKDLDENTLLELDAGGNICAMTIEHASNRTDVQQVTLEGIAETAVIHDVTSPIEAEWDALK